MQSRRSFLRVVGAGAAASMVPFVVGCAAKNSGQAEATGTFSAGSVSSLQPGVPKVLSRPVVVILDDQGVYAMSTICTHAQCDMRSDGDITANSIVCTCHGSEFDVDGNVIKGPAVAALRHFSVSIDASGEITVDADTLVPADTRAAVPS
jgi:cytochrome b6-f complex iron-sulfur subunit